MFDPLNPESDLIDVLDIAPALSMLCRANGYFKNYYSVGRHCINCALEAKARDYSERVQLASLLYDANEVCFSDVTRPAKHELPKNPEIEKPLQESIWQKYLGSALTKEVELIPGENYTFTYIQEGSMGALYIDGEAALTVRIYGAGGKPLMLFAENNTVTFTSLRQYTQ